ncbi:MAG: sulfite exporter TauE/SafE family protein [Clostridia bacterium]|nr:sulfite exporter TauE/SafE family protein [Clostridia bacterium]
MTDLVRTVLFLAVIFLTNIIQGVTGFAGTVLAMPVSMTLVGLSTAKPILNALGLLSGVVILFLYRKDLDKKEFLKITLIMLAGVAGGFFVKGYLAGAQRLTRYILGAVVLAVGILGVVKMIREKIKKDRGESGGAASPLPSWLSYPMLVAAGLIHGVYVCGGPLVVGYMTSKAKSKNSFRATLSGVWAVLNTVILVDDIRLGLWTADTLKIFLPACAVFACGILLGSFLSKKLSAKTFMTVTYVLLAVSGVSLFF